MADEGPQCLLANGLGGPIGKAIAIDELLHLPIGEVATRLGRIGADPNFPHADLAAMPVIEIIERAATGRRKGGQIAIGVKRIVCAIGFAINGEGL